MNPFRTCALTLLAFAAASPTLRAQSPKHDDPAPANPRLLAPGCDLGMWVWDLEDFATPAALSRLLGFSRAHGINRLLVQVTYESAADGYVVARPKAFGRLLDEAGRLGIVVEALDGDAEMGFAESRENTLARIRAILDFNRARPESARFVGIHLDIEPYVSDRWKSGDIAPILREFVETAASIRDTVRADDARLTVAYDLPAWFDQPAFELDHAGSRKPVSQHLQDLADYVGIMSYRTRVTGPESVVAISAGELAYAEKIDRPIYLSLETVPLPETPSITFHGRTRDEYVAAVRELAASRAEDAARGGILLHYYRTMRPLLETAPSAPR